MASNNPYDEIIPAAQQNPYEAIAKGEVTPYTPKLPVTPLTTYFPAPKGVPTPMSDPYTPDQRAAAERGVNIDQSLPYGTSVLSWLADNPEQRNAIIKQSLQKTSGLSDDAFRVSPEGNLEYREPQTGTWMAANPAALSNIPGFVEEVASIAGGLTGGVLGAAGGPAGAVGGGFAGTMLGRMGGSALRDMAAQAAGVSDKTAPQVLEEGMREGLIDSAFNLAGDVAYLGGKGLKTWYFGREAYSPGKAKVLLNYYNKADLLRREVESVIGPGIASIDAAQAAYHYGKDIDTLSKVEKTKPTEKVAGLWDIRDEANDRAAAMFFENTTLPYRMQGVNTAAEGGDALRQAITDEKFNVQGPVAAELDAVQRAGEGALRTIPETMDRARTGRAVRDAVVDQYRVAKTKTQAAYGEYEKLAGMSGGKTSSIDVPLSRGVRLINNRLKREIERAPLEEIASSKRKALLQNIDSGKINLADLDNMIKYLGRDVSKKTIPGEGSKMDALSAISLRKALVKMRTDYLEANHPDVLEALSKANAARVEQGKVFNTSLMRSLIKKEPNGDYKLTSAIGITRMLRANDSEAAAQVADVVKSNPKAMLEVQNYFMSLYRDKVGTGPDKLVPSYEAHRKFLKTYGNTLREFFTDKEWDQVQNIGGFAEVIYKNSEKLKTLDSIWQKDFKGRLEVMSAETLTDAVFDTGKFSQADLSQLARISKLYGKEVNDKWKAGVAESLRNRIFVDDAVNHDYLKSLTRDKGMTDRLDAVFGPGYSSALKKLDEFITVVNPTPRPRLNKSKNTPLSDIARVLYARPLSVEGLMLSGGQRARERQLPVKIYNAMTSASELNRLIDNMNVIAKRTASVGTMGTAFSALSEEEDFYD